LQKRFATPGETKRAGKLSLQYTILLIPFEELQAEGETKTCVYTIVTHATPAEKYFCCERVALVPRAIPSEEQSAIRGIDRSTLVYVNLTYSWCLV
jgi:hypothetical protein